MNEIHWLIFAGLCSGGIGFAFHVYANGTRLERQLTERIRQDAINSAAFGRAFAESAAASTMESPAEATIPFPGNDQNTDDDEIRKNTPRRLAG